MFTELFILIYFFHALSINLSLLCTLCAQLFECLAGEDSEEDEDENLEAAQLEKMVAKLSRIVKHVIPNKSIELDENVDKNTSNWLAQVSYLQFSVCLHSCSVSMF